MICKNSYFGHLVTLAWGKIFKLIFRGQLIYGSIPLDQINTMLPLVLLYISNLKKIFAKKIKNNSFLWCPLEPKPLLTLCQIWRVRVYYDAEYDLLSNAFSDSR